MNNDSQQPPVFPLVVPRSIDVTFSAPYSPPHLLSSTLVNTHQHPGPENDDILAALPQHYPPPTVAFPQSFEPLIAVPSQHGPLQSYETPSQLSPERITQPLDPSEQHSPQPPTLISDPAAVPPSNSNTHLTVTSVHLLMDVEKQKVRTKPTTKKDLRVGPRNKYLPCIGCDAVFDRPSALKLHMLSHTGEKPHECPKCHRRFSVPSNMRRHRATCGIARSRRSFVNITMPPFNTSSDDADRDTPERAARVDACGKYLLSPDEHPDADPSGCSRGSDAHRRVAHHKSHSRHPDGAVTTDQQHFTVRWVEPMEFPNAPTPQEKNHQPRSSNARRRFSTFVMSSPASAAQTSGADSPDRKFQMYRPQLVDDPVPTNEPSPLGSGCIPETGSDQPATTTEMSSSLSDPSLLPSFSNPVPQKRGQNHCKRREEAEFDDVVSQHSLTSGTTLSSVSSASSLCQLHQDSVDLLPTTSQEFGTSGKATTLDQIVCEEPHLADNPAQHSTASVQISSHIGSSSTMDYSQPDGEPTSARSYHPQQTTGSLVDLSQDEVAVFYPTLQHVDLGPEPGPSSLPSVSDQQTGDPQNVDALPRIRKRSRGYSQTHPPHEASQPPSTSPTSSSFPVSQRRDDEQLVFDNDAIQGVVSHNNAGTSRGGNLDHSHGLVRVPIQQGSSNMNSGNNAWPPVSLWHCRNAYLLTSHGPFPWWDPQTRAPSHSSDSYTLRPPVQHLQQGPFTGSSKELRFVHYATKTGRHEAHSTSLGVLPISNDPSLPSVAPPLATTRWTTRGITVPLAPVRPRGSDNRGRTSKKSTRRNTLWLSAPTPNSCFLSINANADSSESAHDMGVTSSDTWLSHPRLDHHHPPHRSSYSEELIPTTMQDSAPHNARYNRYNSLVHVSHRQPVPNHSPPTPTTSHSSHIFSLATDTSEDDDSEESEWEERDSYAIDVPRQPYNTKYWRERLPGPALLAGDLLERDAARARRWLLID